MTPEQEGREAAKLRTPFSLCPYTYQNSGAKSVGEYSESGNCKRKNDWFAGWRDQQTAMGLDARFLPLKTPNI